MNAKEHLDQPGQGTREAALWLAAMADRAAKGAHADLAAAVAADPTMALLLSAGAQSYLTGAQVHALLYIGDQVKALVALLEPTGADVSTAIRLRVGQRGPGREHPPGCGCDSICQAITAVAVAE